MHVQGGENLMEFGNGLVPVLLSMISSLEERAGHGAQEWEGTLEFTETSISVFHGK